MAQITNILIQADPNNQQARYLCADALEQLGYQCESVLWRNAYLTGAKELREGADPQEVELDPLGQKASTFCQGKRFWIIWEPWWTRILQTARSSHFS